MRAVDRFLQRNAPKHSVGLLCPSAFLLLAPSIVRRDFCSRFSYRVHSRVGSSPTFSESPISFVLCQSSPLVQIALFGAWHGWAPPAFSGPLLFFLLTPFSRPSLTNCMSHKHSLKFSLVVESYPKRTASSL